MRIESGPMCFGQDWNAVAIRGDNAMYYRMILQQHLDGRGDVLSKMVLEGLVNLLGSCNQHAQNPDYPVQQLKDFKECLSEPPIEN